MASLDKFAGQTVEYAVGFGLGFALGRALTPIGNTIIQEAYGKDPNKPLDVHDVAAMIAEAIDVPGGADAEGVRTGYDPARTAALGVLQHTAPGVGELLTLLRRQAITEAQLAHGFRKAKIEGEWDAPLATLKDLRVDPAVIATAIQRGVMVDPGLLPVGPPSGVGKVTPMPVSPLPTEREAADSGVDLERLAVYARIVGLPASPDLAARMTFRGIIDRIDFDRAIAEGNTRNEWAPFLFEGFREILTSHEYAELRLRGWIDTTAMQAGAAKHGMSQADIDLLEKMIGRPLAVHQIVTGIARGGTYGGEYADVPEPYLKALQESSVRPEWGNLAYHNRYTLPGAFVLRRLLQDGAITAAEGEELFLEEAWRPDLAKKVADAYGTTVTHKPDPHVVKAANQLWTTIHKSYIDSESGDADATSALQALGVAADAQPKVIALWTHEREIIRRTLTPSEIKKAWKETKFTRDEAVARLERLGFNAADAGTLLDE